VLKTEAADPAVPAESDLAAIEAALQDLLRLTLSQRVHDRWTREAGVRLSRTQLSFLGWLEERPRSVSELAELADVGQPAATRAVDQLEADRLVRRRPDERDGRSKRVCITAAGSRARDRIRKVMRAQLAARVSRLEDGEGHDLAVLLTKFVGALKAGGAGNGEEEA
jgi:DNA-binding MarR family transcriptional regulator